VFKKILIGLILVLIAGTVGLIGCSHADEEAASIAPSQKESAKETVEEPEQAAIDAIPVDELLKEYYLVFTKKSGGSDIDYPFVKGDIVRVKGYVKNVAVFSQSALVWLGPKYYSSDVECDFWKENEIRKVKSLKENQEVIIEGKLEWFELFHSIRLKDCILLQK